MDQATSVATLEEILMEQIKLLNKQITDYNYTPEGIHALVQAQMEMIQMYRSIYGF